MPANPFPFTQRSTLCKSHTVSRCQQLYGKNSQTLGLSLSENFPENVKVGGNTCQFCRSFFCSVVRSRLRWQSLILRVFHRRVRLTLFDRPTDGYKSLPAQHQCEKEKVFCMKDSLKLRFAKFRLKACSSLHKHPTQPHSCLSPPPSLPICHELLFGEHQHVKLFRKGESVSLPIVNTTLK